MRRRGVVMVTGVLASVLTLAPSEAATQSDERPELFWTRQRGSSADDAITDVTATASSPGRLFAAGWTEGELPGPHLGGSDAIVRTLGTDGSVVHQDQFGSSADDQATAVADVRCAGCPPSEPSFVVVGWTAGGIPGATPAFQGERDGFVRAYNSDGTVAWTRHFGRLKYNDKATDVDVVRGDVYVTSVHNRGRHLRTAVGAVQKYSVDGDLKWRSSLPGEGHELTAVDGHVVAGTVAGAIPGQRSAGRSDAFAMLFQSNGQLGYELFQFGSPRRDRATDVVHAGRAIFVAGTTFGRLPGQTSAGGVDAFVHKHDVYHDELDWTRQLGSAGTEDAVGIEMQREDQTRRLIVGGTTGGGLPGLPSRGGSDHFVRAFVPGNGDAVWSRQFGSSGDDSAAHSVATNLHGIYLGGGTSGTMPRQVNQGGTDTYVSHFRVPRVDALIGTRSAAVVDWTGDGEYAPTYQYRVMQNMRRVGAHTNALVRIQNEGLTGRAKVHATCSATHDGIVEWHLFEGHIGTTEVTDAVLAGTYRTEPLATDEEAELRIEARMVDDERGTGAGCVVRVRLNGFRDAVSTHTTARP